MRTVKIEVLKNQEKLLIQKRDRLNRLIDLIGKTIQGDNDLSFNEFDMSEYYNTLENLKKEHEDKIIKYFGSIEMFNKIIKSVKSKEDEIVKNAINQYGSIKEYSNAIKNNILNSDLLSLSEGFEKFKNDILEDKHPKLKQLYNKLVYNSNKEVSSNEVQQIVEEITNTAKSDYKIFNIEIGEDNWHSMIQLYLIYPEWIKLVDKKYGKGASLFIGKVFKKYNDVLYTKIIMVFSVAQYFDKGPSISLFKNSSGTFLNPAV